MAKYWQFSSFSRHERLGEAAGRLQDAEKRLFMLPSMACQCSFSWLFCRPGQGAAATRSCCVHHASVTCQTHQGVRQAPVQRLCSGTRSDSPARPSAVLIGTDLCRPTLHSPVRPHYPIFRPVIPWTRKCHRPVPKADTKGDRPVCTGRGRGQQRRTAEDARSCSIFRARKEPFFGRACKTTSFFFLTMQDILS